MNNDSFVILGIWFGIILLGFASGASTGDARFLNFAYVPTVLLMGIIAGNLFNYSKLSYHFSGMQSAAVRSAKDIFKDIFHYEALGWTIYQTWPGMLDKEYCLYTWHELPEDWFEASRAKLLKNKVLYVQTREIGHEAIGKFKDAGFRVEKWKEYNFSGCEAIICGIFRFLEKSGMIPSGARKIFVFKVTL